MTTTVEVKSYFKEVKKESNVHYGKKRDDLVWSFEGVTTTDLAEMDEKELSQVAVIVNDALESYGKKLLLQRGDDWDFVPSSAEVNIPALHSDLTTSITRTRTVTKQSLAIAGEFYSRYAVQLLSKTSEQASAGGQVIAAKLAPIAAKPDALQVLSNNLLALVDKAAASGNAEIESELETNAPVLEWLVAECERLQEESQINMADML